MSLLQYASHPGEILSGLYLEPLGLSAGALAKRMDVPRTRIERLVKGETGVTPDTALRLARVLRTTPDLWLNLQRAWDLAEAQKALDLSGLEPMPLDADGGLAAA